MGLIFSPYAWLQLYVVENPQNSNVIVKSYNHHSEWGSDFQNTSSGPLSPWGGELRPSTPEGTGKCYLFLASSSIPTLTSLCAALTAMDVLDIVGRDVIWNWLLYYNLWGISNERQEGWLTVQSRTGSFTDLTVSSHEGSRTLTLVFADVMETRSSIHARARSTWVWFPCTQTHSIDSTLVLSKPFVYTFNLMCTTQRD